MDGNINDFCECFMARMRANIQEFQNVMSNNRDISDSSDPFSLSNNNTWEPDATTIILGLFLLLLFGVFMQASKNVKRNRIDMPDCRPNNNRDNSNNDRFQPPPID